MSRGRRARQEDGGGDEKNTIRANESAGDAVSVSGTRVKDEIVEEVIEAYPDKGSTNMEAMICSRQTTTTFWTSDRKRRLSMSVLSDGEKEQGSWGPISYDSVD